MSWWRHPFNAKGEKGGGGILNRNRLETKTVVKSGAIWTSGPVNGGAAQNKTKNGARPRQGAIKKELLKKNRPLWEPKKNLFTRLGGNEQEQNPNRGRCVTELGNERGEVVTRRKAYSSESLEHWGLLGGKTTELKGGSHQKGPAEK